jgi:hypothetical protein
MPDRSAAIRWECQVGAVYSDGDFTIFDVTIETPDVREAIRRSCEDFPSEDIEWIKVRRV